MGTGESLTTSERVQRLQTALHAKAKEAPGFRFYSLSDKVWRDDVLAVAWQAVRRNGGAAGVDGETVADIEALGVDRWLGALARDLKEGTYRPRAVRQVLIPKKQRGKFRPLGIPCLRDRVAQTAAMLVLSPIFEADLQPEQYAYRPGRHAHDAVKRVHRLLTTYSFSGVALLSDWETTILCLYNFSQYGITRVCPTSALEIAVRNGSHARRRKSGAESGRGARATARACDTRTNACNAATNACGVRTTA